MNDRFLRACRGETVDCTPVWFMRQAGRYMPEYRAVRARYSMLEVCKTPELAVEVTRQPLQLGVDAAILFSDILMPLEAMGATVRFAKGIGPVIDTPIHNRLDIDRLAVIEPEEGLSYALDAVRMLRSSLSVPLIGFAGAPFTLASYLIEGGKARNLVKTKRMMAAAPGDWHALMSKLSEVIRRYLRAQVEAGAQAVQLFDSWVGHLGPEDYDQYVAPYASRILKDLETCGVPVIHFGPGTTSLLESMAAAGGTVLGLDWRVRLDEGWRRVGMDRAIQGNLDPCVLFTPREVIRKHTREILACAAGRPGHIFNLGHGILPDTPVDEVRALVDYVHEASASMGLARPSPIPAVA